jgi:hypothetical protein
MAAPPQTCGLRTNGRLVQILASLQRGSESRKSRTISTVGSHAKPSCEWLGATILHKRSTGPRISRSKVISHSHFPRFERQLNGGAGEGRDSATSPFTGREAPGERRPIGLAERRIRASQDGPVTIARRRCNGRLALKCERRRPSEKSACEPDTRSFGGGHAEKNRSGPNAPVHAPSGSPSRRNAFLSEMGSAPGPAGLPSRTQKSSSL